MNRGGKNTFAELRRRAEEMLSQKRERSGPLPQDFQTILHELEVHQEELEIQNEELKRAKEEITELHREYADLYEFAPAGYVTLSSRGSITRINLNGTSLLGKSRKILYRMVFSTFIAPESLKDYYALLERADQSEGQHGAELELRTGDEGTSLWVQCNVQANRNDGGDVREWRLTLIDISESKAAKERLEELLREKDFLMQEINHRVKNNLSMISSLLNIKDRTLGEQVDLSNVSHQIDAIRLIHAQLYSGENITQVRMPSYLRELLETIFGYISGRRVRIIDAVEEVSFSPRTAVPLGLIVNEIATNAMKYGFTEAEEARFSVELSRNPGGTDYVLKLSNSGNPFPEEVEIEQSESFGMQLISTLTDQLEGSLELERRPTPQFTITFPGERSGGQHGE